MAYGVFWAAGLAVAIIAFPLLAPTLLSLLLILLISMAVNPLILRIREWTGDRKLATGVLVAAIIAGSVGIGITLLGPMKKSVALLADKVPAYWERLQKPLIKIEQKAEQSENRLQQEVTSEIVQEAAAEGTLAQLEIPPKDRSSAKESPSSFRSTLAEMAKGAIGRFASGAFNAAQFVVILVTVFLGVIYTLMNPRPLFRAIFSIVPERNHDRALVIVQRIGRFVPAWAASTLLGMFTIGVLVFLLMWPIFGFTDAVVLGLFAGLLEAIPFIGPILSAVPALLFAMSEGGMTPLWVLLAYVSVQSLEGNVILPLIMARGMKMHPVAVIFSMLLCVTAFGVLGVLVAAPLVAIAAIIHDELYRKRFLPSVTDAELDRLARRALNENVSDG